MSNIAVYVFVDVHLSNAKLTLFLDRNCYLISIQYLYVFIPAIAAQCAGE